ncbi:flagellar hook-basal body complex protein [Eubacteriales bacterium OttesenSCG-928-M02]|nr:flagellar hook-basal body complex protein [Eubacteriales bacterium OttesenSCG-928-M02]
MIRGLYLSATNMVVQRRKMDVLTNNIANVETTGYKADTLLSRSFQDMLISRVNDPNIINRYPEVGDLNTGVHIDEVITSFAQGVPQPTEKNSDFCLTGEGFFVVQTPQGEMYTRDGDFIVDQNGYLTTQEGYFVLGTQGLIRVDPENFVVNADGSINPSGGWNPGAFRLVTFNDLGGLRKVGNNLYTNFSAGPEMQANCEVRQSCLEGSNVEIVSEIVDMMGTYRSYETSQRIVRMLDESLGKAVNEVGKV